MTTLDTLAVSMANILTDYCSPVKTDDVVTITGNGNTCWPLIDALYEAVLRRGGHPQVQAAAPISPDYSDLYEMHLRLGNDAQLDYLNSTVMHWIETSDALFFIKAPHNTKALSTIDPARISRMRRTNSPVSERYLQRYAEGKLRWTVVGWPTNALAQTAEMGLLDYTDFVAKACGLDRPDPVAYWQEFRALQERLVAWLSDKSHAEVKGPGIDMSFDFAGRPWVSCHGELNFPDGEIFTSPIEDSVNGTVAFNYPGVYLGNEVDGVRLRFKDGLAVEASASKSEDYLIQTLDTDAGGRRLGEFAIGTNMGVQRMTRSILFDEKIGGSIHMALGRSYEESKGKNESAIHWDMVHNMQDGGEIWIDGQLFYRAGQFMV
jgi:aminopeptidase